MDLDAEVAAILRAHAAEAHLSEGEILDRAMRAYDLRALLARLQAQSVLDEDQAMALAREELKAARVARTRSRLMRVVADANVLVSAALGRSPQAPSVRILDAALDGRVELVLSPTLLGEIADALSRPRIRRWVSTEDGRRFLADLASQAVMLADAPDPPRICRDPDDDYLVALP